MLFIAAHTGFAQYRYLYASLDLNKPLSNTQWIGDVSSRGARIGYRAFINDKFSAGLDLNGGTYSQYKPTETMQQTNGALTTDYFNYVYSYGAVVSGQYYLNANDDSSFLPYVGIGAGANRNEYVMYYNIYKERDTKWGFLGRPEVGFLWKFGGRRSLGMIASVHYDYSTSNARKFGYNGFSNVGFNVGIVMIEW